MIVVIKMAICLMLDDTTGELPDKKLKLSIIWYT